MATSTKRVAIVGGGPVGSLNACFFAKRGYQVELFEMRDDIRQESAAKGKSINLAVSERGLDAMRHLGIEEPVLSKGIPMHGRMIHNVDGTRKYIQYGKPGQSIISFDRRLLNELLLSAAEDYPNVTLNFECKLVTCNFDKGELTVEKSSGERVTRTVDLIVGCDGAHSAVRRQMMRATRMDFSQEYIKHGYMELCMPAAANGDFPMEKNALHIWPRGNFMMIGLPNFTDNTFVMTLFMPFEMYDKVNLNTERDVINFFQSTFPDSIPLIGRRNITDTYFSSEPLPLMTVKCHPYHYSDKAAIMGDAAHAMVPFYGQGMNAGFEDCLVLDEMLNKHNDNIGRALAEYTEFRNGDAKAMCDLALSNYVEMRHSVNTSSFLMRKKLDNFLYWLLPNTWVPLYTMVSFSRIRYLECMEKRKWQDQTLAKTARSLGMTTFVAVSGVLAWAALYQQDLFSKFSFNMWK